MKFQCQNCQGVVETDFDDEYVSCGHCSSVCHVPTKVEAGVVIDDFSILHLLGQGGMGDVYLAHQFSLDRKVALKILKEDISLNEKFKTDFIKEARSVASLNHPKIVQAFKVGEEDGKLFFAMECIEGDNLQDMLKAEGALEELMVLKAARDVAEALGYAWDNRKLVHRDIKPENIMLGLDGSCKVMDLGLSCNAGDFEDDGDTISGTPQYISPEQILGQDIDNRSDFYCLGATLYHLLSGRQPFDGDLKEMIRKHIQESPASLKKLRPELSGNTAKIVHKLMNKNPQDRYLSTIELLRDIDLAIKYVVDTRRGRKHFSVKTDSSGIKGSPTTSTQSIRRPKKKSNTVPIVIGSMVALIFMTFLIVYFIAGGSNKPIKAETVQVETKAAPVYVKKNVSTVKKEEEGPTKGLLPGLNYTIFQKTYKQAADLQKESVVNFTGHTSRVTTIGLKTRNENFGCIFSGYVNIPYSETYQFSLKADDRCLVYIDGKKIVSAVYPKAEKRNIILDKGLHKIKVYYVQGRGEKELEFKVSSVSVDEKSLPTNWLFRDPISIESNSEVVNSAFKKEAIPEITEVRKEGMEGLEQGLNFSYYEVNFDKHPDPTKTKPKLTSKSSKLDINHEGRRNQHFAYKYWGYLNIPKADVYTFMLYADDVASVSFAGKRVLYSEVGKAAAKYTVKLPKGLVKFSTVFRERNSSEQFSFSISSESLRKKKVPDSWFYSEKDKEDESKNDKNSVGTFSRGLLCELYSKDVKFEDLHVNRLNLPHEKMWLPTFFPELARDKTLVFRGFLEMSKGKYKFQLDAFGEVAVYVNKKKIYHSVAKKSNSKEIDINKGYHLVEIYIKQSTTRSSGAIKLSNGGKFYPLRNKFVRLVEPSFKAQYFYGKHKLDDLEKLEPSEEKTVSKVTIKEASQVENYSMVMSGKIMTNIEGEYEINYEVNDKLRLYIDDELVVDGAMTGDKGDRVKIKLRKGIHSYKLMYLQATGRQSLQITLTTPNRKSISFSSLIVQ